MRRLVLVVLAGCGRIGFDPSSTGGDAIGGDDASMFVPPSGELDPTFGSGGITITSGNGQDLAGYAVMQRPGGYLVVGERNGMTTSKFALLGFTPDGLPDPAYGSGGLIELGSTDDFGYGAVRIGSDRIVINGDGLNTPSSDDNFVLAMIDDHGAAVATFGSAGFSRVDIASGREDTANRVALAGSTLIACGIAGYDATDSSFVLYRFDVTGAPVGTWGSAGKVVDEIITGSHDECFDAVQVGTDIIAVGHAGTDRFAVVAYHEADGSRDTGFATNGLFDLSAGSAAATRVIELDGDIVVVGERAGKAIVVRLAPDGTPRSTFGSAGVVVIDPLETLGGVAAQPDGKIVVAGTTNNEPSVARLGADGALDPSFGTAGILQIPSLVAIEIQDIALDPDGKILLAGIAGSGPFSSYFARIR